MLNQKGEIKDYIEPNSEGVWEWKEKTPWNSMFLEYFKKRDDDDLSEGVETKKLTS
jgi:hypothetical protein